MGNEILLIGSRINYIRKHHLNMVQKDFLKELNSFIIQENIKGRSNYLTISQTNLSDIENDNKRVGKERYFSLFIFLLKEKNINLNYIFDHSLSDDTVNNEVLL